ncbi:hypothetical protein EV191_11341 [Tamaricihabitans halophyticus]|uniref:DUF4352 domain-containing protein n=1 Tax=Tamaricihabitans halophyticus TaxID=1262583 RepID=A0A4R2QIJ0_9PSEU|nr:hypothetical protein [Tamaricihabitans halophyticus]TCP46765.1 hypothetical protein EV191_11341 [Tamaricihabitans halophyticus]
MRFANATGIALGACLCVLAIAGCAEQPATTPASGDAQVQVRQQGEPRFGETRELSDGLRVTVSQPKEFQPSDTAYPQAARAVSFEITLDNAQATRYHLADMSVLLTADGQPMKQVIDSTQGYTGMGSNTTDVTTGGTARFTVAFTVPPESVPLELIMESGRGSLLTYTGSTR